MGLIGKLEALDVPLYAAKDDDASSMAGRAPVSISEMERCFKMGFIPPLLLLLLAELGVVEVEDGR